MGFPKLSFYNFIRLFFYTCKPVASHVNTTTYSAKYKIDLGSYSLTFFDDSNVASHEQKALLRLPFFQLL